MLEALAPETFISIAICLLGTTGYIVARHIHHEKKAKRPLVCPMHFDCNAVVHSDYSKFLGVPVELFGMVYYAFISFSYLVSLAVSVFLPHSLPPIFIAFVALSSLGAFIFSLYLVSVQTWVLKKFCSWCLVSAVICALIFVLTVLIPVL